MVDESTLRLPLVTGIRVLILISIFIAWYKGVNYISQLDAIPTVGFSDPLLSYLSAVYLRFVHGAPILKEMGNLVLTWAFDLRKRWGKSISFKSRDWCIVTPHISGIFILLYLFFAWYRSRDPLLDAIPTVGYSDPIFSYLSAFRYHFLDGRSIVKQGYEKAKPGLFKIATFRRWIVLPSSAELIEDVRKAPEAILSKYELFNDLFQEEYTFGMLNEEDNYHSHVIRSKLTRNLAAIFHRVHDEAVESWKELIPAAGGEWVKISILPTVQQIICRASSRVFVGTPLCLNHDYQMIALNVSVNVMKVAYILSMFPKPLKPIVAWIFSDIPSQVRQTMRLIEPMVKERFAKMDELGKSWEDAPDDMLMWLMREAKGVERSLEGLARRLLFVNFASIHTTGLVLTQVLCRLVSNPEYIEALRQEADAVIAEEGWTKAGIDKMRKLDSFVRETQRMDVLAVVAINHLALRPFTFSNGVTIPAGTVVAAPSSAIHMDEEIYSNAQKFDGFRFSKLSDINGDAAETKYQAVITSPEHLSFGFGRHACPGRYFAINNVKALVAHIIVTYDIKVENSETLPREMRFASPLTPGNTEMLFRKRQK